MTAGTTPPRVPGPATADPGEAADVVLAARVSALEAGRAAEPARSLPWYRQASVLIAALALVVSVTATRVGEQRAAERDQSAARVELSQLIQRLSALPRESTELLARYSGDPATSNSLSGMVQTENAVLAHQASDVITRISGQASGTEYLAVGQALRSSGDFGLAQAMLDAGLARENDATSAAALWRAKGGLLFDVGQPGPAREAMSKAIDAYSAEQASVSAAAGVSTEWLWASYEQSLGACDEVKVHLDRAQAYVAQLPMSQFKVQMMASLTSVASGSTSACPSP